MQIADADDPAVAARERMADGEGRKRGQDEFPVADGEARVSTTETG